jgi:DNA-binding NarL/FixJ family response regulator
MRLIADRAPAVPLVLLSDREELVDVARALASGIRAYIPTSMAAGIVIEVLNLVLAGGTFVPAHILRSALPCPGGQTVDAPASTEAEPAVNLTPRQRQVLQLISHGKQNKVIAHALHMEEGTVKVHLREIMRKLKAQNRTQVALLAARVLADPLTDTAAAAATGDSNDCVRQPHQGIGTSNLTGSDKRTK